MSGLQNLFEAADKFISPTSTKVFDSMMGFSPVAQFVDRNIPIAHQFGNWAKSHPAEFGVISLGAASGLGAAGLLGGGGALAGAGALSDAALSAAPAASSAGGMGGLGGFSGAEAAITPAFESGLGAASAGSGAGAFSGLGTLGTAGTGAATSAITPTFGSMAEGVGATGGLTPSGGGLFDNMSIYDKIKNVKSLADAINTPSSRRQNMNYATYNPNYAVYNPNINLGIYGY